MRRLVQQYGAQVTFVNVYVTEPHPLAPDIAPMRGVVSQMGYSTMHQPHNYSARVENARATLKNVPTGMHLLVDDLSPHDAAGSNPVWCTYGPNPNGAWLIGTDGKVVLGQQWFEETAMEAAIRSVVSR